MNDDKYIGTLEDDDMHDFLEFALNRTIPNWVQANWRLPVLDLGPGRKLIPDAIRLDWPDWNGDEANCLSAYADDSVGGIFSTHFLEHLADPRHVIAEAARVLAPGCPFTAFVPHARSDMFLQDLDHKTPFILSTWRNLLSNPYYGKGRDGMGRLEVGVNIAFALKDENLGILTQLIKVVD